MSKNATHIALCLTKFAQLLVVLMVVASGTLTLSAEEIDNSVNENDDTVLSSESTNETKVEEGDQVSTESQTSQLLRNPTATNPANVLPFPYKWNSQKVGMRYGVASKGDTGGYAGLLYAKGISSSGYQRWFVEISRNNGQRFVSDQTLSLSVEAPYGPLIPTVHHDIQLHQGDTSCTSSFLIPIYDESRQNWFEFRFRLRGKELPGLFTQSNFNFRIENGWYIALTKDHLKKLIANEWSDLDDRLSARGLPPRMNNGNGVAQGLVDSLKQTLRQFEEDSSMAWGCQSSNIMEITRLPEDWLELAGIQALILDDLEISELNPGQRSAIAKSIAAGNELIIAKSGQPKAIAENTRKWLKEFFPSTLDRESEWEADSRMIGQAASLTYHQDCGLGRVSITQNPIHLYYEGQTVRTSPSGGSRIESRNNVSPVVWMIPSVGTPPVLGFTIAIIGFTMFAGPGLIWLAHRRWQRPLWLLIILPIVSAIITFGLIAYALVKDGFDTHSRVMSFTAIDNGSGFGAAFSRQTYFSGFPLPSISFRPDSEVWWNIERIGGNSYRTKDVDFQFQMDSEKQEHSQIFLPRQQSQWVVTTPVENFHPFAKVIEETQSDKTFDPDKSDLRLINTSGQAWDVAYFCDVNKKLWIVTDVSSADQEIRLDSIDGTEFKTRLKKSYKPLKYPDDVNIRYKSFTDSFFDNGYSSSTINNSINEDVHVKFRGLIEQGYFLTPNTFCIFATQADHLDRPRGVESIESPGQHIIWGTW